VANPNPDLLVSVDPIVAVENNFDCSMTLSVDQANFTVGSNYTVQLANILNLTDVYAESQPFDIKPFGSAYPPASATPADPGATSTGGATSSSSSTGSASSPTKSSAAVSALSLNSVGAFGAFLAALAAVSL